MNIRVVLSIVSVDCFYDGLRFLGRGRVIEIDEWFSVDLACENWKIFPDPGNIYCCDFFDQYLDPRTTADIGNVTYYKFTNRFLELRLHLDVYACSFNFQLVGCQRHGGGEVLHRPSLHIKPGEVQWAGDHGSHKKTG